MSLYKRQRGSKPNHPGSYSKGFKVYKAKNHAHQLHQIQNTKQEMVTLCKIPRCKHKVINNV